MLKQEIAAIEMNIRAQNGSSDSGDCLAALQTGMTKVLTEMTSSGQVPPDTVQTARASMEKLFIDLTALAAQCQQTAA
eukprot:9362936-Karenia_brevis.AAC.1